MRVTALIPTFNRRKYIFRAIESVLAQTVPVDEIVVVDDGSTDGTADALEAQYGNRVRVVRQKNSGVSGARWRGIREARGEWIAFLDSDDEWLPERTEQLLKATTLVPDEVAWIFGDLCVVTDEGCGTTLFQEYGLKVTASPQVFRDSLSVQYPFQFGMLQGSLVRRSAFLDLNCFSEGLRSDDDLLAGFQVACRYKVAAIPSVVGKYFRTSDLAASSVVVNGVYGRDYYRSRMLAFAAVIKTGRWWPWNVRYASEVRGLCKLLASQGQISRRLVIEQFRYGGFSPKGLAFLCAGMMGAKGFQVWNEAALLRRRYFGLRQTPVSDRVAAV